MRERSIESWRRGALVSVGLSSKRKLDYGTGSGLWIKYSPRSSMESWAEPDHVDERGGVGRKEGRRGRVAGSPSWEILLVERPRVDVAPAGKPCDQSWAVASRVMMYQEVESRWWCR
jgi:hypothetical protein